MFSLHGKVAVVTGARRGIGRGIVLAFARQGADVVVSDIDLEDCQKVVKEVEAIGRASLAIKCDVTSVKEVNAMVKETVEKFGKIDILVNNAGIYMAKPVTELKEAEWDRVLAVNLKSAFLCSRAAARAMIKQEKGKIISIASIAGEVGYLNSAAYCASKAGIINLTRALALELAPYKINVNAIAPGCIETAMTRPMLADPKVKAEMLANIPLKRIGKPQDVAACAVFLASDEADYVTGHTLFVDGGWLAH